MKIEILGCSGAVAKGYNTTSILIDGSLLIDAGSAASVLPEERLCDIEHILLTHPHIDHVKELPFILEALYAKNHHPVTVWGSSETIRALDNHIFNGVIWPKIRELNAYQHIVVFREVPAGEFAVGGVTVSAHRAFHIPGAFSYHISDGSSSIIISGDTGLENDFLAFTESFDHTLKAIFVEVSFPDRMEDFAKLTRHLTPSLLTQGLADRVPETARVIAYHMKPRYKDEVVAQLPPNVAYITGGEVFQF
jgi:ribonuclease BN (tRNA processing enzyme)